jgi:hypothetical protein
MPNAREPMIESGLEAKRGFSTTPNHSQVSGPVRTEAHAIVLPRTSSSASPRDLLERPDRHLRLAHRPGGAKGGASARLRMRNTDKLLKTNGFIFINSARTRS